LDIDASVKNVCEHIARSGLLERAEVVGVGTGRTVRKLVACLGPELFKGKVVVPSSLETALYLKSLGLRSAHPSVIDEIDVYIDGADFATERLELIKGGGGALTLEKILASVSRVVVICVDKSKLVESLLSKPIPIEVVPYALSAVKRRLEMLGLRGEEREPAAGKRPPVVSDIGGAIIDVHASGWTGTLRDLNATLKLLPGVVETGLFIDMADLLLVGHSSGIEIFEGKRVA